MRKIDLNDFQVATSETARDINRRIVLNLIRKHQPVSRAELSRQSGLQRSTVSAITEELISERWVKEGALGYLPRGRKPVHLHINEERAGIIGINIRPSGTTLALAALDTRFLARDTMPTSDHPQAFLRELNRRIAKLRKSHSQVNCEGIGIALPGRVDPRSGRLIFAPNLGWDAVDLKEPIEEATGLPVQLENAANACALAELWSGRHDESVRNLVAVTVSEGIGVGLILNGQLITGASGLAGEFGHVTLDEDGPPCQCGNRGCWEVCGSNSAAIRYYSQANSGGKFSRQSTMEVVAPATPHSRTAAEDCRPPKDRGRQTQSSFDDLLQLARRGDAKAVAALNRMAHFLGAGLAMLVSGLAPDAIVVIGEVTGVWDSVGPIVERTLKERLGSRAVTPINPSRPDLELRLRGTITLVLQKHFGAPSLG
ncbi:MAG TPA: ROK family transcriptional regulator [Tepidisphaeraceae bacterium]|nr:ROK family transcriptional regulator [Tepidisphaeraceae bacterium]